MSLNLNGNRAAVTFQYYRNKSSNEFKYGNEPLVYLQDSDSGNYIELGYNTAKTDLNTRFVLLTQEGMDTVPDYIPQPLLVYTPGLSSDTVETQDDVPMASGITPTSTSIGFERYERNFLSLSHFSNECWTLGRYNKALWFGEDEPFILEMVARIPRFATLGEFFNLGFDSTAFTGMKFEKHLLDGFKFSWGDGSAIKSITAIDALLDNDGAAEFLHYGIIRTVNPDRIALYINGIEYDSFDSPGSIDQSLLYAGSKNPQIMKNIFGAIKYFRLAVGDMSIADFSYSIYSKDNSGNAEFQPYYMAPETSYAIAFEYQNGGIAKDISIFNPYGNSLRDYFVEIGTGFSDPSQVCFESLSGEPLKHFEFFDKHYVKIPFIASSGLVDIRAINRENNYNVANTRSDSVLKYDDFSGFDLNLNPVSTNFNFYYEPSDVEIENNSYSLFTESGLTITHSKLSGSSEDQLYFLSNFGDDSWEGYKFLFGSELKTSPDDSYRVFGATILADAGEPTKCVNIALSVIDSNFDIAGTYFGGTYTSFTEYEDGSVANNYDIVNSGVEANYYEITCTKSLDISITNRNSNASAEFNATGLAPGIAFNNKVGFFIGTTNVLGGTVSVDFNFLPIYVIPYVGNEPVVTVSSNEYKIQSFNKVYINGEQQF